MVTRKDIEYRTIYVINCIHERHLRVSSGELLLEDAEEHKTLTKLPFQKILALFVVGNITITTPLIEKCQKYNVALVVTKPTLRPVFYWSSAAEANYLVRRRQYAFEKENISIAKKLVSNKIANQLRLLQKTRQKNELMEKAKELCQKAMASLEEVADYNQLMGMEGRVAKAFFAAYFHRASGRRQRE